MDDICQDVEAVGNSVQFREESGKGMMGNKIEKHCFGQTAEGPKCQAVHLFEVGKAATERVAEEASEERLRKGGAGSGENHAQQQRFRAGLTTSAP